MVNAHKFSETALNQKIEEDGLKEEEDISKLEVKKEEMEIKVSIVVGVVVVIIIIIMLCVSMM
jgi:hypothetical protein